MSTKFGSCPCGGTYEVRNVDVRLTVRDQTVLLNNVPQGACSWCGSRVYKAGTLAFIEALYRGETQLKPEDQQPQLLLA